MNTSQKIILIISGLLFSFNTFNYYYDIKEFNPIKWIIYKTTYEPNAKNIYKECASVNLNRYRELGCEGKRDRLRNGECMGLEDDKSFNPDSACKLKSSPQFILIERKINYIKYRAIYGPNINDLIIVDTTILILTYIAFVLAKDIKNKN